MAAITTIIAVASLAVGAASYVSSQESRKEASSNYANAAVEQRKAQSEQKALNAQRAANERRQQVREERVQRAKVLQASENTGTDGSSGEFGATGGLATQLGANIGTNLGQIAGANRISDLNQSAANFNSAAQSNLSSAQGAESLFGLSNSIFNAAGGFGTIKTAYNKATK